MQAFVFTVDGRRMAVPASLVSAVTPRVRTSPMLGAPPFVPGLMDLRGQLVPVVDASLLCGGPGVPGTIGARIVVLEVPVSPEPGAPAAVRRLGLLVERVLDREELSVGAEAWHPGAMAASLPFLGAVGRAERGEAQLLDAAALLRHARLLGPGTQQAVERIP